MHLKKTAIIQTHILIKHYFLQISSILFCFILLSNTHKIQAQTSLFGSVKVSDSGTTNTIGSANTSRNIAINNNGTIYIVYRNSTEIRFSKSTNRGQTFSASSFIASVTDEHAEPEIAVNSNGTIFIAWKENEDILFCSSVNAGSSFLAPRVIDTQDTPFDKNGVHMATFNAHVYLADELGTTLYINRNNGNGLFSKAITNDSFVYADVLTDENGKAYLSADKPDIYLFEVNNTGNSLAEIDLSPLRKVYFSSYTLSDGPCGTFIFVAGRGTEGFKINVKTGTTSAIEFGNNAAPTSTSDTSVEGRTLYADNEGTLVDGYRNEDGQLLMNISDNQGDTFQSPILIDIGNSHSLTRNPFTNDISVVYEKSGEIYVSVYENLLKKVAIPSSFSSISICESNNFTLPFTLTGTFDSNTEFTVILSDEDGDFENFIEIGSSSTHIDGTINCTIPSGLPQSSAYRLKVISANNCLQSNAVNIAIDIPLIRGEFEIFKGNSSQLIGTGIPNDVNPWTSSDTSIATVDSQGNVLAVNAGTTTINYTNNKVCTTSETIVVVSYPTFFTPNGDGKNDVWNIVGFQNQEYQIAIFNRYGKLLKTLTNTENGWDGTYNGNPLPATDYWFQLQYFDTNTNAPKTISGHFSLVK